MNIMETKYEVQFKTGDGSWRRWALCDGADEATASRTRLLSHLGQFPGCEGFARIIEVRKPQQ